MLSSLSIADRGLRAVVVMVAVLGAGCATPAKFAGGKAPTVAVIAGVTEDANLAIVTAVTQSLQSQSRQPVVSQAQIARTLTPYPQNIQGPYRRAYFEIEIDWDRTDKAKIAGIQRALGVDYLCVIWAPTSVRNGALTDYVVWSPADIRALDIKRARVPVVVQLFTAAGGKEVWKEQYLVYLDNDNKPVPRKGDSIENIALKLGKEAGLMQSWWRR